MKDLISRQAAIDAILQNQEVYSNNFGDDPIDKYTIAIIDNDAQTIAQLPSAQPEQKKGKWVEFEFGNHTWHKCSFCGCADKYKEEVKRADGTIGVLTSIRNFCPNCGADMRGEQG